MKDIIAELRALAKRSHPELNPKLTLIEQLAPYGPRDDTFVSMTEIQKVGINPHTKYDTPAGIYAYPLRQFWKEIRRVGIEALPFAAHKKYVNVLESKNVVDVTEWNIATYEGKMRALYEDEINTIIAETGEDVDGDKQIVVQFDPPQSDVSVQSFDDIISYAKRQGANEAPWVATHIIAKIIHGFKRSGKIAFTWNGVLRKLGFKAISDRTGNGIIHPNEKTQAVFLSRNAFQLVDRFENNPERNRNRISKFIFDSLQKFRPLGMKMRTDGIVPKDWLIPSTIIGVETTLGFSTTIPRSVIFSLRLFFLKEPLGDYEFRKNQLLAFFNKNGFVKTKPTKFQLGAINKQVKKGFAVTDNRCVFNFALRGHEDDNEGNAIDATFIVYVVPK